MCQEVLGNKCKLVNGIKIPAQNMFSNNSKLFETRMKMWFSRAFKLFVFSLKAKVM